MTTNTNAAPMADAQIRAIACALAELDGYDPKDQHCGLYDLRWSGGPNPEPEGDTWHMDYLPKAEKIAAALNTTAAVPPQGWVMVPVEPTPEIVKAIDGVMWPGASEKAYRAMRAAAPTTQAAPHLPERDATVPAEQQGLFRKFDVRRIDGTDRPGGKHHGCLYFVLDVDHDPCARAALTAYAVACEATHPALAADLRSKWGAVPATQASPQPAVQQGNLRERCSEILAWRKTGVLSGPALRYFAGARYGDAHDALQMAERDTETEALHALAHHPAAPVAHGDAEDAARWRTFVGLPYALRAEWAVNLSLVPVLTQWVDQATIDARSQAKEGA